MAEAGQLLLIDATGDLFRAWHALPRLTNAQGEPTGALVGVLNMLRKLLATHRPDYVGVVFDAGGPNFRHALYPEYKANRPPCPEELRAQIAPLQAIIRAMGLPCLAIPGVEADDVLATLASRAQALGIATLIATSDKDLAQLVSPGIALLDSRQDRLLDRDGVIARFGVPPERMVDYLALVGDSVDNVPGVPKCGPKTAVKWLGHYGDLDGVIAAAAEIPGKLGENLRAHLPRFELTRALVTLNRAVALDRQPTDLRPGPPDRAVLRDWYQRLEARRLLAALDAESPSASAAAESDPRGADAAEKTPAPPDAPEYEILCEADRFALWLERLRAAESIALSTSMAGTDPQRAPLVGIAFAVAPGQAAYLPLAHAEDPDVAATRIDRDQALAALRPLLEDPARAKVGHNLKDAWQLLANHGIALRGIADDCMLQGYVLDSAASRQDLANLARVHLQRTLQRFEDLAGKGARQLPLARIPLAQAGPYAAEQAEAALCLQSALWPRLQREPALAALYREIEMPLLPVLARMERAGVALDVEELARQSQELAARLAALEERAHQMAGARFNLGSPKQIAEILFVRQGLAASDKTPQGQPSTAEAVLERLVEDGHELPRLILEHRGLAKLRSAYTDKLPRMIHPDTGRLHTHYQQAVTATGRLASSDPNLQNIPIRSSEGRRIRRAFVCAPGTRLLAADYSQIELRLMAHLSGDARLLAAFAAEEDIHRATAAEILGLPPEQVSGEARRSAKAINFGLIYGMSAFGLARQLGIERAAAQRYMDTYFARYPGVHDYMERIRQQARASGQVQTLFGRRLRLPDIGQRDAQRRAAAERAAINAPLQGSAADIIKRAMITLDAWIDSERPPVRMLLQVHDELVFEVAEDAVPAASARIRAAMEGAAELAVPLRVAIGVGANWDEAH